MTKWSLDRHIPVALLCAFLVQTVGFLTAGSWVASKYDSRLSALESIVLAQQTLLANNQELVTRIDERVKFLVERPHDR